MDAAAAIGCAVLIDRAVIQRDGGAGVDVQPSAGSVGGVP